VIGKKTETRGPPLSEVTYKGFDHANEFNPAEHTDTDRLKKEEAVALTHDWWMQRMNPKKGWTEMHKDDGSRLDHGMSGYHAYDQESRCGRAMAHCYVNATPKQVAGYYADLRNRLGSGEALDFSYTTMLVIKQIPIPVPTISDRESMYRSATFKNEQDNSYTCVFYTVEDARRPVEGGKVRIERCAGVDERC
jgi:hypothetical protein